VTEAGLTFGVVIPVFGSLEQISICVQSVENQTRPWDCKVAVLDAVNDKKIKEIFLKYQGWIVLENNEPMGIITSTQLGISTCNTDFLALVDCDDVIHSRTVETIVEVIETHDNENLALLSFCYESSSDIDKAWEGWSKESVAVNLADPRIDLAFLYGSESQLMLDHAVASHLKVYRRDLIESVPLEYHGVQDAVASHLIGKRGEVLFRPEILYLYRVHNQQTSAVQHVAQIRKINRFRTTHLLRGLTNPSRCAAIERLIPWLDYIGGNVGNSVFVVVRGGHVEFADYLTFMKWAKVYPSLEPDQTVLFSVNAWFDFGALPGFSESDFHTTLILDQTSAPLDDVAKWYGGYFDAVLLKSSLDSTLLRQFLPLQLLLTVGENSR